MRITKDALASLAFMLAFLSQASSAPLEAYAKLPLYENVVLSPDATKAAFVTTVGDERQVIIQPLSEVNSASGIMPIKAGPQKLRGLRWAGPDHLVINTSDATDFVFGLQSEVFATFEYDLIRKKAFNPWEFNLTHSGALITVPGAVLPASNSLALMGGSVGDRMEPGAVRFDLEKQTKTLLDAIPPGDYYVWYAWVMDETRSRPVLRTTYDDKTQHWSVALLRKSDWVEVQSETVPIDTPTIIGLGPEAATITMSRIENGETVLRRISLTDGKWGEALPEKWQGSEYVLDPKNGHLVAIVKIDSRRHYVFFDPELQSYWDQVVQSLPGEELRLESWSEDWQKMIVRTFGKQTGAGYVFIDIKNKTLTRVGNLYSGIEPTDIAAVKPISYTASDGLQISGYLTVPNGKTPKNLPLIVVPHGGPASRDTLGFDWFAQALASRGYLVLQPNFRGSTNLGLKLQEAGYGEWGRKMQTDLSDGVNALVKLGIVDPERVCIAGMSYGGYAALAAAAFESGVYRCAASVAGVSDLKRQLSQQYFNRVSGLKPRSLRDTLRYVDAKEISDPVLHDRSPALHVEGVSIPILLVHGSSDAVVPFEQSEIMASALKKANKPYEFIKLKSEDHWLSKADTRLQMLQAVVKFLETNNPP